MRGWVSCCLVDLLNLSESWKLQNWGSTLRTRDVHNRPLLSLVLLNHLTCQMNILHVHLLLVVAGQHLPSHYYSRVGELRSEKHSKIELCSEMFQVQPKDFQSFVGFQVQYIPQSSHPNQSKRSLSAFQSEKQLLWFAMCSSPAHLNLLIFLYKARLVQPSYQLFPASLWASGVTGHHLIS